MASRTIGIDGCRGGWVAAITTDDEGVDWRTAPIAGIADLLDPDAVVGIDMPIGLRERGRRECDDLARKGLPGAASRVFTTPPRAVLELGPHAPNDAAQALCRQLMGTGVSRQALHLAPRILALDASLRDRPVTSVIEVHPELSFAEMAGRVLLRKKSPEGVRERLDALRSWLPGVEDIVSARPREVPVDDAVDALAALWSALRWRDGSGRTIPTDATERPFIAV